MKTSKLSFAIQKKGRLKEDSLAFLRSFGYELKLSSGRSLMATTKNQDVSALFVRHSDIPEYVQAGVADFGIVGKNVLHETDFNVEVVSELEFGFCKLVIAVPEASNIVEVKDLESERIATSYPNSLKKFLQKHDIHASISLIKGSVEATPSLGLADAICDLTQTGLTLQQHRLRILETAFSSNAVLVKTKQNNSFQKEFIGKLKAL